MSSAVDVNSSLTVCLAVFRRYDRVCSSRMGVTDGSTVRMALTTLRSASGGRFAMMVSVIMLTCAVLAFELDMRAILIDVLYSQAWSQYCGLACLLLRSGIQRPKRRGRMGHGTGVSIRSRTPVNRIVWAEVAATWPKEVGLDIDRVPNIIAACSFEPRAFCTVPSQRSGVHPHTCKSFRALEMRRSRRVFAAYRYPASYLDKRCHVRNLLRSSGCARN